MADEDIFLEAMDQYIAGGEYTAALRRFVDDNCDAFVDVASGAHGLEQNDVFKVPPSPAHTLRAVFGCVVIFLSVFGPHVWALCGNLP